MPTRWEKAPQPRGDLICNEPKRYHHRFWIRKKREERDSIPNGQRGFSCHKELCPSAAKMTESKEKRGAAIVEERLLIGKNAIMIASGEGGNASAGGNGRRFSES